ncbi:hypothetical protein [Nodosilinea sp. E11]|uniref:hypothetical protein n=1 Tax=Nodosilinea sp. E11 TaxID=3037479 RepID=UPI00293420A1|nr:hypothetical protein [Nodosilinea sp. E11]WOD37472.1 hypothetical protein RRF56_14785 [Nodosilinea sp. E11]
MATDYILFIHGVNTRYEGRFRQEAETLLSRIRSSINDPSRVLKPVYLFWGNVGEDGTKTLLSGLESSSKWRQSWFQKFRTEQILPFVGDAALYLSRGVSAQVVRQITDQALCQMGLNPENLTSLDGNDRLHLVTHSWGTVILFDILFALRWETADLDPSIRQNIMNIRTGFFGLGSDANKNFGIPIASIHTMGSPITLFSLINLNNGRSFDLTPNLKLMLESLYQKTEGKPLPWMNYVHPGDPIAYALEGVMRLLLQNDSDKVKIEDVITTGNPWMQPFSQTLLPLINGGKAHGSYWSNQKVANAIAQVIASTGSPRPSSELNPWVPTRTTA